MFFQRMLPLLGLCQAVNITVSQEGNLISLVVTPMPNANSPTGLRVQQVLKGTAQEIDEGLAEFLASTTLGVKSIQDQLAENEANTQAEKKRLADSAKSKSKQSGKSAGGSATTSGSIDDGDESEENDGNTASNSSKPENVASTPMTASTTAELIPSNLFGDD